MTARGRIWRVTSGTAAALLCAAIGGCSAFPAPASPVLIVHNRTESTIAFLPMVVVAACESRGFSQHDLDVASDAFYNAADDDWIPAGAVRLDANFPPRRKDAVEPLSVIITKDQPLRVFDTHVDLTALPPCDGEATTGE